MKTGFLYDPVFLGHRTPAYHPEAPGRLEAIIDAIADNKTLSEKLIPVKPRKATKGQITAVHTPAYYTMILNSEPGHLDGDTFFSEGSLDAALYAAGGVIAAVDECREGRLDAAFCAVRPPGHHAESGMAMGFCIFNNIAIGAAHALARGYKKIFIVDFDVHHGNGTQNTFYGSSDVFYFSTHESPHYPGTGSKAETGSGPGKGFTCNIPLHHGTGDDEFSEIYNHRLHDLVRDFDPDIMFVSAGYDIREEDPLSSLEVTNEGIKAIVTGIVNAKRGIPLVFALEGGYDLAALAESVVTTLTILVRE